MLHLTYPKFDGDGGPQDCVHRAQQRLKARKVVYNQLYFYQSGGACRFGICTVTYPNSGTAEFRSLSSYRVWVLHRLVGLFNPNRAILYI